ncbi:MAG: 2-oxo acid dehydrogenase subunit E2 [Clostridia bacterium]|nr:2-oxo acid dehydrogenase subunit E2 [Clostridia bacterium]
MAVAVIMPRQGNTVESCIITKWHKQKGDSVKQGDMLFTYETDKATFDEEAEVSGKLLEIFFKEGDDVPVLTNMCVIGQDGEDVSEFMPGKTVEKKKDENEKSTEEEKPADMAGHGILETEPETGEAVRISPRARNRAEKQGLDINAAKATGPSGRIIERDIEVLEKTGPAFTKAAAASYDSRAVYTGSGIGGRITAADVKKGAVQINPSAPASAEYEDENVPNIRKVIGKAMQASLATMAQLTINMSFDASSLLRFRTTIKTRGAEMGLPNITLNDMVVYATARTLLKHRDLNAHFSGEVMRRFNTVNMGVAVDTDRGLMVPTLYGCDRMTLPEICERTKEIASMSKAGTINPDLLKGGTFTITNLGTFGVESFTPVINPPQTAILGVCGLTTRAREENGRISTYQSMGLSLTIDHRAVDGAPAARFLKELCVNLENFEAMLLV